MNCMHMPLRYGRFSHKSDIVLLLAVDKVYVVAKFCVHSRYIQKQDHDRVLIVLMPSLSVCCAHILGEVIAVFHKIYRKLVLANSFKM